MKVSIIKPDFSYAMADYLRSRVEVSAFFSEPFPVGTGLRPWTKRFPVLNQGLFGPRWNEIIALEDLPYVGVSPIGGGFAHDGSGFCDCGFTLISHDYVDTLTRDNDLEFNMHCALSALQKIFIEHTSTGVDNPVTTLIPVEYHVRQAVGTDFRFRKFAANADSHFIKIEAVMSFELVIYNPFMP